MKTTDFEFNIEDSKQAYKRYFDFEYHRALKTFPVFILLMIGIGAFVIGLVLQIDFLWMLAVVILAFVGVLIGYFRWLYKRAFRSFSKELEEYDIESERKQTFIFDEEGLKYKSKNSSSSITWELIKKYAQNGEEVYLYLEREQLFDIISLPRLHPEDATRFKELLVIKNIKLLDG